MCVCVFSLQRHRSIAEKLDSLDVFIKKLPAASWGSGFKREGRRQKNRLKSYPDVFSKNNIA